MRPRLKQTRIDLQPGLEVLLGEDRVAGGDAPNERQPDLLTDGVFQLDPPRGPGNERDDALAGQGPQVLFGGVRRTKAQLMRNFGPGRRHSGLGNEPLDQAKDLGLAGSKVGHGRLMPVRIYSYCDYIQTSAGGKRHVVPVRAGILSTIGMRSQNAHSMSPLRRANLTALPLYGSLPSSHLCFIRIADWSKARSRVARSMRLRIRNERPRVVVGAILICCVETLLRPA